mgnify:CR=1 FL=1
MAAKLYDKGFIRTGTILAVFIATSDEALIILISDMNSAHAVMPLVLIKLLASVGIGQARGLRLSKAPRQDCRRVLRGWYTRPLILRLTRSVPCCGSRRNYSKRLDNAYRRGLNKFFTPTPLRCGHF